MRAGDDRLRPRFRRRPGGERVAVLVRVVAALLGEKTSESVDPTTSRGPRWRRSRSRPRKTCDPLGAGFARRTTSPYPPTLTARCRPRGASRFTCRPISATPKESVQESCIWQLASTAHNRMTCTLTRLFAVPGTGFEPVRTFVQGGLRLHFHVRCVRLSPSALLTSAAAVRPVSV